MSSEDALRQTTMCPRYKGQVIVDVTGRTALIVCLFYMDLELLKAGIY